MRYFPLFLDIKDKPVLLVGGGEVAARKFHLLSDAGASITVVAPQLGEELAAALARGAGSARAGVRGGGDHRRRSLGASRVLRP